MEKGLRFKIISTAGVLFAQKGFFGVSMQDIANELGVTKAALYHHFTSKEELCFEIMQQTFKSLRASLGKALAESRSPHEALLRVVDAYLAFTAQNPQTNLLFMKSSDSLSRRINSFVIQTHYEMHLTLESTIAKIFEGRRKSKKLVLSLTAILLGFLTNHTLKNNETNRTQIARNFLDLVIFNAQANK